MSEPFIGEIQIVAFDFVPRGWASCDGALLAIAQNQALFSLLGTTYGGNGVQTFALPNLQNRVPMHRNTSTHPQGEVGGEASHTLTTAELPQHTHQLSATSTAAEVNIPTNAFLAQGTAVYQSASNLVAMAPLVAAGTGAAHENRQPSLGLNFVIALVGLFPSRN